MEIQPNLMAPWQQVGVDVFKISFDDDNDDDDMRYDLYYWE